MGIRPTTLFLEEQPDLPLENEDGLYALSVSYFDENLFLDEERKTGRRIYKEAFMVTEQGDFRWLKMEVRLNGELVGEGAEAEVKMMTNGTWEYPSPSVHDLRMNDLIHIENVGKPIEGYDVIEVLYDNYLLASVGVVLIPKDQEWNSLPEGRPLFHRSSNPLRIKPC